MSTPLPPPPPPPWAAANPPGPEGSIPPSAQTPLPWPPGGPALPPPTYTTVSAPTRALAITALILALAGFLGVTLWLRWSSASSCWSDDCLAEP